MENEIKLILDWLGDNTLGWNAFILASFLIVFRVMKQVPEKVINNDYTNDEYHTYYDSDGRLDDHNTSCKQHDKDYEK